MSDLQPRQRGLVRFDTSPHGAQIYIDGYIQVNPDTEESIKTPATLAIIEGRRDYVLKLEGHTPVSGYVDVYAGSKVEIFRNLEPIPGSNIRSMPTYPYPYGYPGRGDLSIDSSPQGGYVYIDGYAVVDENNMPMKTPVIVTDIMEGIHEIQIALDGYYGKKVFKDVVPNQVNEVHAVLASIYY